MENNDNKLDIEIPHDVAKGSYSNLAIITHSHSEFILDFATMLPGLPKASVSNRLIMTPEHAQHSEIRVPVRDDFIRKKRR